MCLYVLFRNYRSIACERTNMIQ
jgi:dynactin 1